MVTINSILTPSGAPEWLRPAVVLPGVAAVALLGWIGYLAQTLPGTYVATGWDAAWIGLDALLAVLLAATGWLTARRHPARVLTGFGSSVLLIVDAWFDVMTATGTDQWVAVVSAAVFEVPLAAFLGYWAVRAVSRLREPGDGSQAQPARSARVSRRPAAAEDSVRT